MSLSEELKTAITATVTGSWERWAAEATEEQKAVALKMGEDMKDPAKTGPMMAELSENFNSHDSDNDGRCQRDEFLAHVRD